MYYIQMHEIPEFNSTHDYKFISYKQHQKLYARTSKTIAIPKQELAECCTSQLQLPSHH